MNSVNPVNSSQPQTQTTNTTSNTQQPNKPGQPVVNNQQKPNYDQLMKDFNDPNKKINTLADLKNYGINIDQK